MLHENMTRETDRGTVRGFFFWVFLW